MNPGKNKSVFLLISLLVLIHGCSKKDPEEEQKEALIYKLTGEINTDSIESHVKWLQSMGTRFTLSENRRNVAVSIRNKFIKMGFYNAKLDSFSLSKTFRGVTYNQLQYNVIAVLEAGTSSDSSCIIGAHYDNITGSGDPFSFVPGANDNASGLAAVIEIARVMKKYNYIPSGEIRFVAFGAEELGLYGSSAYASDAKHTTQKIRFMLNNDMIAYEPSTDKRDWMVNIMDYANSQYIRKEAQALCYKYTLLKPYNDNTYNAYSDSYPFYVNGYKAIFFFSRLMDPDYHSINDLYTNCSFEYCREIIKLNCAFLVDKN